MPATSPETAELDWRDGRVPVSRHFDDPYYSLDDGLAESRHVFLAGNGLPGRFKPGFHIAELGFGTGLNMLAAWSAWRAAGQTGALSFTSFEIAPLARADMARALAAFPELADLSRSFLEHWRPEGGEIRLEGLNFTLIKGDARQTLPAWQGRADAWFLDGFAPARNPELWQPGLLRAVARHTAPGGSFATYSAAGEVRRALESAGFTCERRPGFGRKRHMSAGTLRGVG